MNKTILLRDPTDDRYPYKPRPEEKSDPIRWELARFGGLHPWGIIIETERCFAYLDDDGEHWDYAAAVNDAAFDRHENPWVDRNEEDTGTRSKIWHFWSKLDGKNQAWATNSYVIRYEDILDIDPNGDSFGSHPHVFIIFGEAEKLPAKFKTISRVGRFDRYNVFADPGKRIKIFPDEFPDPQPLRPLSDDEAQ